MPPMAAARYSTGSEAALELITQAIPTRMPPTMTTQRGPSLSTRYPSTGTSQVSISTKMVNATCIASRPQWYFASMGLTNSVQPYCKFATDAIQMMPITSCTHELLNGEFCERVVVAGLGFALI